MYDLSVFSAHALFLFALTDLLLPKFPALAFALCGILAEVYLGWDRHVWDVKLDLLASGLQLRCA